MRLIPIFNTYHCVCKNTMTTITSMTIVSISGSVAVTVDGHSEKHYDHVEIRQK